jgi:hypothetical protein
MSKATRKSKTVGGNVVGMTIIAILQRFFNVELSGVEVGLVMCVGNIVLRYFTHESLERPHPIAAIKHALKKT